MESRKQRRVVDEVFPVEIQVRRGYVEQDVKITRQLMYRTGIRVRLAQTVALLEGVCLVVMVEALELEVSAESA